MTLESSISEATIWSVPYNYKTFIVQAPGPNLAKKIWSIFAPYFLKKFVLKCFRVALKRLSRIRIEFVNEL